MDVFINFPNSTWQEKFLASLDAEQYSYNAQKATQGDFPNGFNHDKNRVYLGHGKAIFEQGKASIRQWQMFPPSWTRIFPKNAPIEKGQNVGMAFRLFGLWWINSCRIVYTIDTPQKYGFAYGTLPRHVEKGEELFMIEMLEDGSVWYKIEAFSRPNYWFIWLAYPLARYFQGQFVLDSKKHMQKFGE